MIGNNHETMNEVKLKIQRGILEYKVTETKEVSELRAATGEGGDRAARRVVYKNMAVMPFCFTHWIIKIYELWETSCKGWKYYRAAKHIRVPNIFRLQFLHYATLYTDYLRLSTSNRQKTIYKNMSRYLDYV